MNQLRISKSSRSSLKLKGRKEEVYYQSPEEEATWQELELWRQVVLQEQEAGRSYLQLLSVVLPQAEQRREIFWPSLCPLCLPVAKPSRKPIDK